ncbi:hypothetical protein pb186bvf_015483 [Paramecium bursaria]
MLNNLDFFEDVLYLMKRGQPKLKQIEVRESMLTIQYKVPINIQDATMERISSNDLQGIRLRTKDKIIEIFGKIDNLETYLRRYTTQLNFTARYRVIELIGTGQYSQVYKIKSRFQNDYYAAKIINKSAASKAIYQEINILRAMNHPNVLTVLEVFETKTNIIIVQQLMNSTLSTMLKIQKVFNETQARQIIKQILEALKYCASLGIFHRDIKPDNIMLKNDNDILIGDFGMADYWNYNNQYMYNRCGTPGYVAPEILKDLPYTTNCDVYSAGIILYYMLTGQEPFKSKDVNKCLAMNMLGRVETKNLGISTQAEDLLQQLLEPDYLTRITAAQALTHNFFQVSPIKTRRAHFKQVSELNLQKITQLNFHTPLISPKGNNSNCPTPKNLSQQNTPKNGGSLQTTRLSIMFKPQMPFIQPKIKSPRKSQFLKTLFC